MTIAQSGPRNSQYGLQWITNGVESKKIKKEDPIPEGWNKGRKIAGVAQLVVQCSCKAEVEGSNPFASTNLEG